MSYMFNQRNKTYMDIIETYRWVTNKKVRIVQVCTASTTTNNACHNAKTAYQTTYFQNFHRDYDSAEGSRSAVFNSGHELRSVLEVADIIDELKMIQHLLQTQKDVLQQVIHALRMLNPSQPLGAKKGPENEVHLHMDGAVVMERGKLFVNVANQSGNGDSLETTKALAKCISGIASQHVVSSDATLLATLAEIGGINDEAKYTHKMVSVETLTSTEVG
jgi:hypothetical protein